MSWNWWKLSTALAAVLALTSVPAMGQPSLSMNGANGANTADEDNGDEVASETGRYRAGYGDDVWFDAIEWFDGNEAGNEEHDVGDLQQDAARDETTQSKRMAMRRFVGGFYLGYMHGYRDAADERMLVVVRPGSAGEADEAQPSSIDRDQLRQMMRDELRERGIRATQTSSPRQHLSGEVIATKSVELRGVDKKHLIALVKTDAGKRKIVDVGLPEKLAEQGVKIEKGRKVDIRGRSIMVGDIRVIKAGLIQSEGKTVRAQFLSDAQLEQARRQSRGSRDADRQDRDSEGVWR